jgi:hypothetical protein
MDEDVMQIYKKPMAKNIQKKLGEDTTRADNKPLHK